jgi:hypothetical protein
LIERIVSYLVEQAIKTKKTGYLMKTTKKLTLNVCAFIFMSATLFSQPIVIDHSCTSFIDIPNIWIDAALEKLDIVYTHTSHGSQLTTGMSRLDDFKNDNRLDYKNGGSGSLDLHDNGCSNYGANDLGNPNRTAWEKATRDYLAANPQTNVVVWSWCGQVSSASEQDIDTYLNLMNMLEVDFPNVRFVYMTGHVIEGARGNNFDRNEQIRSHCRDNNKILYDFADIECYNPDGVYFGDKWCTDGCLYDSNGDGNPWNDDANWAIEWQNAHVEGIDWYSCSSAHSHPLNANQKAWAAWWLWARLAGWDGNVESTNVEATQERERAEDMKMSISPNPFNATTTLRYSTDKSQHINVTVYNLNGTRITELVNEILPKGDHSIVFNASDIPSGIYYFSLRNEKSRTFQKFTLLK